jgi:hypothetical protein
MVFAKARSDSKQVYNLITNLSYKLSANSHGEIVYWDQVADSDNYKRFSARMRSVFLSEKTLASELRKFVKLRVDRFGLGAEPDREADFEREYLLSEVCMSVFCTEVLGYCHEIWERPPAPQIPDPVKLLYNRFADVVMLATSRPTRRVLSFLYET